MPHAVHGLHAKYSVRIPRSVGCLRAGLGWVARARPIGEATVSSIQP